MASCEALLEHALAVDPRLDYLQLDPATARLTVAYRGAQPGDIDDAVNPLVARLTEALGRCPYREDIRDGKRCSACHELPPTDHPDGGSSLITVSRVGKTFSADAGTLVRTLAPGDVRGTVHFSWRRAVGRFLTSLSTEAVFVLLTAVGLVAGGVIESRLGLGTIAWLAYALAFLFGGYFGLTAGIATLRERKIDIDLLMILAAAGAAAIGAPFEGALLLFLFSLSNVLQDVAMERTRSAIEALIHLSPSTAEVWRESGWFETALEAIKTGDRVLVRPGGRIPLDGIVVGGQSAVDESIITGESRFIDKEVNDSVLAGTMNGAGSLQVQVTSEAKNSTVARIVALVEKARENKAKTEHLLERFEQWYTVVVILATVLAALIPTLLLGHDWGPTMYRAITLMVAASPCALIISTPASVLSALGNGARRGILFKGGVYVEQAARTRVVAFDKTGTLTYGTPEVTEVLSDAATNETELLTIAAALEAHSEHAIAASIRRAAEQRGIPPQEAETFRAVAGNGVEGVFAGATLRLGNERFIGALSIERGAEWFDQARRLREQNRTVVLLARRIDPSDRWEVLGLVALSDRIRAEARAAVAAIQALGVPHIVMLTGDNHTTATAIAAEAGISEVVADLLPQDKLKAIEQLQRQYGHLAMVGDGVNDAPALARADLGIAMGTRGTDVAMETADVVLMGDSLENIPFLLRLSHATRRTLLANLSVALGLIALMIAGIFLIDLPLPLAVLGHEGGTVLVSLNGMRLLWFGRRPR